MNTYIKNIFNLTRWYSQFQECQGIVRKTFFIIWFVLFLINMFLNGGLNGSFILEL